MKNIPLITLIATVLLYGCSTPQLIMPTPMSPHLTAAGDLQACAQLFVQVEQLTLQHKAADVQQSRIKGFPYLRVNRFLASFDDELQSQEALWFWVKQLRALDQASREIELGNIPDDVLDQVTTGTRDELSKRLQDCGAKLVNADHAEIARIRQLTANVKVPDSYSNTARFIGLYPVSSWFVKQGVKRLHKELTSTFGNIQAENAIHYVPDVNDSSLNSQEVAEWISEAIDNPLQLPQFTSTQLQALFERHAPIIQVNTQTDADYPGKPYWGDDGKIHIDTDHTVVYQLLSYTRFNHQVLAQLNYMFWFPQRPLQSAFDLLGGHIDGINWRVTLSHQGEPLIYDAMHNCGCYHLFFPTQHLEVSSLSEKGQEPILVPRMAPKLQQGERLTIMTASGSHYIEDIGSSAKAPDARGYELNSYDELRSLSGKNNDSKSMFDQRGLVAGTERKERWVLWPMGVLEPGAMRQWGHHATAFAGRRHFDAPDLFNRYFRYRSDDRE